MMKKCTKCGIEKSRTREYFYFRSNGWITAACKECTKEMRREYVVANYEKVRKSDNSGRKVQNKRIKEAVFAAYGGYKCTCCGETEKLFLTIDHINNNGADHRRMITGKRNSAGIHTYKWLVKNEFPDGFQVLCMNCNHGKRMNKGVCPHHISRVTTIHKLEYAQAGGSTVDPVGVVI